MNGWRHRIESCIMNSETAQRKLDGCCNSLGPGFWASGLRGSDIPLFPRPDADGKTLPEEWENMAYRDPEDRKEYQRRWRAANPGYWRTWAKENPRTEYYRKYYAQWRKDNPESYQKIITKYRTSPKGKAKIKAILDRPHINLKRRMAAAVWRSLKGEKTSRWMDLVGYTGDELRIHLQRQFLPKMGWHNTSKWHIDHIVPLAFFRIESEADPAFKAAWALTNLRPIWAAENMRKNARREFLL
jgi:hypothetical protein